MYPILCARRFFYLWIVDKTKHLRITSWALGNTDRHFSPFSDTLETKTILLIEKMINGFITSENNHKLQPYFSSFTQELFICNGFFPNNNYHGYHWDEIGSTSWEVSAILAQKLTTYIICIKPVDDLNFCGGELNVLFIECHVLLFISVLQSVGLLGDYRPQD